MESNVIRRQGYSYTLVNIDCMPASSHFNVVMDLDEPVEELLPYLAATLPGCTYVHGSGVVNVMDAGHIVAIYPHRITITYVKGHEEAQSACESYYRTLVEVRDRRETITPILVKRLSLTVLEIFKALPKTSCGDCGSETCMAFAARVFRREASIGRCTPLMRERERHEPLFHQLQSNGYETT